MYEGYLPISKQDMQERGIKQLDFVYVCGDAYVDHPSFGHAIIARLLEAHGYTVGIIAQPDWKDDASISVLGVPRLGFLVSAGNMDSMVNHYSVSKKRRATDSYTPGGVMGKRPDYATVVYCNLIRHTYKKTPIIIGGIEASLRRLAHYDYWSNKVKRSILLDSGADLISYGMGEHSIIEIADALNAGIDVHDITFIDGTVFKTKNRDLIYDAIELPDYDEIKENKRSFAQSFYKQYCNTDPFSGKRLFEPYGGTTFVVQNPPAKPLTQTEMDEVYALPYMRNYHPSYEKDGGVPAIREIKFSLISNRGCFGGCSFCALTFHQGRIIQTRSHESIIDEAKQIIQEPDFKGYIHDVGGPTGNFRGPSCEKQMKYGCCRDRQCLFPNPCPNINATHAEFIQLLRKLRALPGVKKVFIRSGLRYDYILADPDGERFIDELVRWHVSGQLRVAPEHASPKVLRLMGKPPVEEYVRFKELFEQATRQAGKEQYVLPYLISSHPGCSLKEAVELAEFLRDQKFTPEQVQDFIPTPGSASTCMFYTGINPFTGERLYVPRGGHEKALQRALLQYKRPENRPLVEEALRRAGRSDLIGYGPHCLIRPEKRSVNGQHGRKSHKYSQKDHYGTGGKKNDFRNRRAPR